MDLAGNCHISFESIYIHKEGISNPFTRKQYLRSLFSPKAERVLRVLLTAGPREWKIKELAEDAGVSVGHVSNVKELLADQEWIDAKAVGFSLVEPFALLEEWSQNYNFRRNEVLGYYTLSGVGDFEYRLAKACGEKNICYGLTGFSGGARYAPGVRYQRMMAFIQGNLDELVATLEIKPVDSGANLILLKPYDEGVFYGMREIDGVVVKPDELWVKPLSHTLLPMMIL